MKSTLQWTGDRRFLGQTESGHSVVFGTANGNAPKPGPSAMELILVGAGGCSAWDIVSFLEDAGQNVEDVIVELDADRADDPPKVFTRIHLHYVVKGRALDRAKVEQAINVSVEKYCSGTAMLEKTAAVTHDFDVVETT